jgi:outer membrane translocation and assembly module TamA
MIARAMHVYLVVLIFLVFSTSASCFAKAKAHPLTKKAAQAEAVKKDVKPESEHPDKSVTAEILPVSAPGLRDRPEAKVYQHVCGGLFVTQRDQLKLGTMENRLVCGDGSGGEIGKPWAEIPPNEMAYFLKGFLQTRGFHKPEFTQDEDRLYVKLGPVSRLKTIKYLGGPEGWEPPRRRLIYDEPLTPALLNDTQTWSLSQIKDEGYACAENEIHADPETGEVAIFYRSGLRKRIRLLEQKGDAGVNPGALNRYNAFVMDDYYKERMIGLTRRRTLEDGFLQTLVMTTNCGPGDQVTLVRDVSLGPPRTVRIGAGGSTQEGPLVKVVVRQARIGSSASNAQVQLRASYLNQNQNVQSLRGNYNWYYLKGENRYSLRPSLEFKHEVIPNVYNLKSTTVALLHDWTFDTTVGHYDLRAGPGFISEDQQESKTDHVIKAGYVEVGGRWTDHDFEWFDTSPRTGEYIDITGLFALERLGSNFTAQKVQVQGEKLWSIGRYDPPLFILGTRFNFSTVFTPNGDPSILPTRFLAYLGGDADLRGFSYASLPRSGIGALTAANASVEGRLHRVLFRIVDVFAFLDTGILGSKANAQFEQPIFWSPGFGLRWESPFGVLRGYVARRFTTNEKVGDEPYDKAFRFGVTFGEEF